MTFETIDCKHFALNPQDSLIRNGGHLKNFLRVLVLILFFFDLENCVTQVTVFHCGLDFISQWKRIPPDVFFCA